MTKTQHESIYADGIMRAWLTPYDDITEIVYATMNLQDIKLRYDSTTRIIRMPEDMPTPQSGSYIEYGIRRKEPETMAVLKFKCTVCKVAYDTSEEAKQCEHTHGVATPRIEEHHAIAEEIACLLDRKRSAYGTENIRAFGEFGVLVRVSDKIERLKNLHKKGLTSMNDESVEDSWWDLAGYAILAIMLYREQDQGGK